MSATIHFITGYHGNVGKSTFASVLEFTLSKSGRKTHVFDCDEEKQSLTKIYGEDNINQCLFSPDPELADSADLILNQAIADNPEPIDIIVDLAADTDRFLNDWLENRGVASAADKGRFNIIKWWVSSDQSDSLDALLKSKEKFPNMTHVLVKNHCVTRPQFWKLVDDDQLVKAAYSNGLKSIDFYRGFGHLVRQIQAKSKSWQAVLEDKEERICSDIDKLSYEEWLAKNEQEILSVYDLSSKKTTKRKKTADAA